MKPVFIDTNVFIYASGEVHPLKSPCVRILESMINNKINGVTNTEVLQEILYIFDRKNRRKEAVKLACNVSRIMPLILPVTLDDMILAADFMEKYREVSPRDTVHAAVMLNNDIHRIISADRDFDRITEITRIDPSD